MKLLMQMIKYKYQLIKGNYLEVMDKLFEEIYSKQVMLLGLLDQWIWI